MTSSKLPTPSNLQIKIAGGKASSAEVLDVVNGLRLKAAPGAKYIIQDPSRGNQGPDTIGARRSGKNLILVIEGKEVIIEDYYAEMAPGYNAVIGQDAEGAFFEYVAQDPSASGMIPSLPEGGMAVAQALGSSEVSPAGAVVAAAFPVLGALGFLGAGAVAVAAIDTGGSSGTAGGGSTSGGTPSSPVVGGATDNAGTQTGTIAAGGTTDDSTPTLNGKGTAGDVIRIFNNGTQIGSTTVDAQGNWTFTPGTPLVDGPQSITTTATDSSGNVSTPSAPLTFNIDTTPPPTPAVAGATDNAGTQTGTIAAGGTTDDSTPTLNGKGTAGDVIRIFDNGNLIGSTTVDAQGNWTFTPSTPLVDGSHAITTTATDSSGNVSTPSAPLTFNIDTTPPATPAVAGATDNAGAQTGNITAGSNTDDNTPTLGGKGTPGDLVRISNNGTQIGSTTVDAQGNWTFTPSTPLVNGPQSITTTATDPAGNTSNPSAPLTFNIDTTSLATPAVASGTDNVGFERGPIAVDGSTDDNTPTLGGKGTPGDLVRIFNNGTQIGSTTVDPQGNWTFTPGTPLVDGPQSITTTATDPAGNTSKPSPALNFNIDTAAPAAPSMGSATDDVGRVTGSIAAGSSTDDNKPAFSGSGTPGETIQIYNGPTLLGSTTVARNGLWSFTPSAALTDGAYSVTAVAVDAAGNTSPTTSPLAFTIDTTPPATPAVAGATDNAGAQTGNITAGSNTDDNTPTLGGKGTPGDLVRISNNGVEIGSTTVDPQGNWTFTPGTPLVDGPQSITTTATDPAGNTSSPSAPLTFNIDTTPPATPAVASGTDNVGFERGPIAVDGSTDDNTPTLGGKGTPGDLVRIFNNGTQIGSTTVDPQGNWTFTPGTPLVDGPQSITTTATDSSGNVSTPSAPLTFSIDTTPPATPAVAGATDNAGAQTGNITTGSNTDDNTPTLSGTGAPGNLVRIFNNGTQIGSTTVDPQGNWTFTPGTPLVDGSQSIATTTTDPTGNTSSPSAPLTFNVDTAPPAAPSLGSVIDDVGSLGAPIAAGSSTDDNRPTFNGSGTPGQTIQIYNGATLMGSTTVAPNGLWSFTPSSALTDGAYSVTAVAVDAAGNTSPATTPFAFTIDTTPPATPAAPSATDNAGAQTGSITAGSNTDDNTPTLGGKGTPGDVVRISNNGVEIGSTTVDPQGNWTFTPGTPLVDGPQSITTTATDPAGNTSSPSTPLNFNIDATAPAAPTAAMVAMDDVGFVVGQINNGTVTDDTLPQLSGKGVAGHVVKVYDGSTLLGSTTVGLDGSWSMQPSGALAAGSHSLTYSFADAIGNESAKSPALIFTVAGAAPSSPAITSVSDNLDPVMGLLQKGASTNDPTLTVKGTAEAGRVVKVYEGLAMVGSTVAASDGSWSLTTTDLGADGLKSLTAVAEDVAGQLSPATGAYTVVLDRSAPSATGVNGRDDLGAVQGPISNSGVTDDATPTFSGTGVAGNVVNIFDQGVLLGSTTVDASGNWSFTPTTPLTEGSHAITTTQVDAAGNASAPSAALNFSVDTSAVTIAVTKAVDDVGTPSDVPDYGSTNDRTPQLVGKATAGTVVTISENGLVLGSTTTDAQGNWALTLPNQTDGVHTYTALATNAAGTQGMDTFRMTVDATAPAAPLLAPVGTDDVGAMQGTVSANGITDDTQPTFSGSGTPGELIKVYDGNTLIGSAVVGPNGQWSATPTAALSEGIHAISTTATDAVGNESAKGPSLNFTVDTTAPAAPVVSAVIDNVGAVTGAIAAGSTTDDTQPTLSGTGTPGDIIKLYNGTTVVGSTTVGPNGQWSLEPASPLSSGAHSLSTSATDPAGNESPKTSPLNFVVAGAAPAAPAITSVVDDLAANTGNLQKGDSTNDPTLTVNGTAVAGSVVNVYAGQTLVGSATVGANGTWSVTTSDLGADGVKNLTAVAVDGAGQTSPATGVYTVVLDRTAPGAPTGMTGTDDVGAQTGPIASGSTIDDSTPTFSGSGTAGDVIKVYDGATLLGSTTVAGNGSWSFTPASPLSSGTHAVTATATDEAGNTSTANAPLNFTVDTSAVTIAITKIVDNVGTQSDIAKNGLTNDNTPTLVGMATPNAVVTIREAGLVLGSTTADATGQWSFTASAQTDGAHTYTAVATNAAGTQSTDTFGVTIDTTAPAAGTAPAGKDDVGGIQGTIAQNGSTDDTQPTFSGSGTPGEVVTVYTGSTPIGSAVVDANGTWSMTPSSPLTEGTHAITTRTTDAAGNTSGPSAPLNFTVDTTAPNAPVMSTVTDDVGDVTGDIAAGSTTDDTLPQATGTGTAGEIIKLYDGSTLVGSTVVDANGSWSVAPNSPLAAGRHTFTTSATDAAGNESARSSALVFNIAGAAPAAPAISSVTDDLSPGTGNLQKGEATNDGTLTVSGTGTTGTVIRLFEGTTLVGSATVGANGTWSVTTSDLGADGVKNLTAVAVDGAGQTSPATGVYNVVLDRTAPSAPTGMTGTDDVGAQTGTIASGSTIDDSTPTFSGSGTAGDVIKVYDGATLLGSTTVAGNGSWSFTPTSPLSNGAHAVTATATDAAGNTGPANAALAFTIDTSAVAVSITKIVDNVGPQTDIAKNGLTNDNTPTLVGTASANAVVTLREGTTVLGSTTADATGAWSLTLGSQNHGAHTYTAVAMNAAGTQGTDTFDVTIDTDPPAAPSSLDALDDVGMLQGNITANGVTDDTQPTFSGSGTPGELIKVYDGNTLIGSAVVAPNGTWSMTPAAPLAQGLHSISTTATDAAGNESAKSAPMVFTVDTTAPDAPTATALSDNAGPTSGSIVSGSTTDDNTPTMTGNGNAGDIVKVYDGTTLVGSTTVGTNGTWSFTPSAPIAEGAHTYSASATDAAGNESAKSAPIAFTVDTTAPTTTAAVTGVADDAGSIKGNVPNGGSTDDTSLSVSGTITGAIASGDVVQVFDGTTLLGNATVAGSTWTFADTRTLSNAQTVSYTARVTDAVGNAGTAGTAYVVTVDTQAPNNSAAVTGVSDDVGSVTGPIANGGSTDDTSLNLNGTLTAALASGDVVQVFDGTTLLGNATVTGTTWTFADTRTLSNAQTVSYTARVVDAVGNATAAGSAYAVTVNTSASSTTASVTAVDDNAGTVTGEVANGGTTDDTSLSIRGAVSAALSAGDVVRIYDGSALLGTATVSGTGWTFTDARVLTDGQSVAYRAAILNSVGTEGPMSSAYNVTVDLTAPNGGLAPVVEITTDANNNGFVSNTELAGGALISAKATFASASVGDRVVFSNGTTTQTVTLTATDVSNKFALTTFAKPAEGASVTVSAYLTDAAGNSGASASDTATLDTMVPTIAVARSGTGTMVGAETITFTLSEESSNFDSSDVTVSGGTLSNWSQVNASTYTATFSPTANTTGTANISVASGTFSDAAGNTNTDGSEANNTISTGFDTKLATLTSFTIDLATASDTGSSNTDNITSYNTPTITGSISGYSSSSSNVTAKIFHDVNNNGVVDAGERVFASNIALTGTGTTRGFSAKLGSVFDGTYNIKAVLSDGLRDGTDVALLDNSASARLVINSASPNVSASKQAHDALGYVTQSAGDFNGDGFEDVIAIAPHSIADGTGVPSEAGTKGDFYILYGSEQGIPANLDLDNLSVNQGIRLRKTTYVDTVAGHANKATSLGDINGDGFDDVAIGSQNDDHVNVIFGGSGLTGFDMAGLSTAHSTRGFRIDSGSWYFASSVAGMDVNSDGFGDIIVGNSQNFGANQGGVYIIYGHSGARGSASWANIRETFSNDDNVNPVLSYTDGVTGTPNYSYITDNAAASNNNYFGAIHTSPLGDVNNDGYKDLLVLAPWDDAGATDAGSAYVIYGRANNNQLDKRDLSTLTPGTDYIKLSATQVNEMMGGNTYTAATASGVNMRYDMPNATAGIGDINGDGIADFAMGSYRWNSSGTNTNNQFGQGRVYVMYGGAGLAGGSLGGLDGNRGFYLTSSAYTGTNTILGFTISSGGDFNADGLDDFIVTAPGANGTAGANSGVVYIVQGQHGGSAFTTNTDLDALVTSGRAVRFQGAAAGDYFGTGADLVDMNSDGIADAVIGATQSDVGATNAGALYTYTGSIQNLTQGFTTGDDTLAAGESTPGAAAIVNGVDIISGAAGNDTITGIGTDTTGTTAYTVQHDVAYGGAGNDTIALSGLVFTRVDGGIGTNDTLRMDFSGQTLDLTAMGTRVQGFETFDLGSGGNTLKLRLGDVINQSDESAVLMKIQGTNGTVDLTEVIGAGGWSTAGTTTVDGNTFNVYHHASMGTNTAQDLLIQQGLTVM